MERQVDTEQKQMQDNRCCNRVIMLDYIGQEQMGRSLLDWKWQNGVTPWKSLIKTNDSKRAYIK